MRRLTIEMTRAPRARTRSTVRLVSVVVPDWLTATTSVSDRSAARSKPDSSVASIARTRRRPSSPTAAPSTAARLWAATAAVPWPMTMTRRSRPAARSARRSLGNVSSGSTTCSAPSRSTSLPRKVLRNDAGASVISFSRKCGESPRSMSRVVIWASASSASRTGRGGTVVGQPLDAVDRAGRRAGQPHDLATGRAGVVRVGRGLAVEAEIAIGLLDQSVGLGRDDVGVVGQTNVQRLPAATQGEEQIGRARWRSSPRSPPIPRAGRRSAGTTRRAGRPAARFRDASVGITLASVVISAGMRRPSVALRSAKLSTSPLSTAVTKARRARQGRRCRDRRARRSSVDGRWPAR